MKTCNECGTTMKMLFTSFYCPNDCDLKARAGVLTVNNKKPWYCFTSPKIIGKTLKSFGTGWAITQDLDEAYSIAATAAASSVGGTIYEVEVPEDKLRKSSRGDKFKVTKQIKVIKEVRQAKP